MKRGDLDAAHKQLCHHRLDFGFGQHEVAHDERAAGIGSKPSQPPSASAGLMVTPSAVTEVAARCRSGGHCLALTQSRRARRRPLSIDFVGVGLTCERNHDAEGSK